MLVYQSVVQRDCNFNLRPYTGFAIITWNNPKNWRNLVSPRDKRYLSLFRGTISPCNGWSLWWTPLQMLQKSTATKTNKTGPLSGRVPCSKTLFWKPWPPVLPARFEKVGNGWNNKQQQATNNKQQATNNHKRQRTNNRSFTGIWGEWWKWYDPNRKENLQVYPPSTQWNNPSQFLISVG